MKPCDSFVSVVPVVILLSNIVTVYSASRGVTHEDIRDAVLSFVHMFRDTTDKLERHEYRERQLGEQLKKMIAGLDKRGRDHENGIKVLTDTLTKIESRLHTIETGLEQYKNSNGRDKETYTVDTMNESIQSWMNNIESLVRNQSLYISNDQMQLEAVEAGLNSKIDRLASSIERIESIVLRPAPKETFDIVSYEGAINRFEDKLSRLHSTPEEWHKNVQQQLDDHGKILVRLNDIADNAGRSLEVIPTKEDVKYLTNSTLEEIERVKYELIRMNENSVTQLQEKLDGIKSESERNHENLFKAVTDAGVMAEGLYADVQKSYEQLSKEVKALSKVEQVLIQTADNVLDTKRRIEYGVHQILLEVGDLVKSQAKDLNTTVNKRFDDISETIVVNHNGGFNNLSSKIETEISQVWRQIGIMYQQLTASADALDRLQQQTETYVNGSIQTMDSMEGKVGLITSRMTEVDDNLNYLLGRLSLVTQEFNQIKTGLGTALDNIRSSFLSVQDKVKDVGPGPKPIEDSAAGEQDNKI